MKERERFVEGKERVEAALRIKPAFEEFATLLTGITKLVVEGMDVFIEKHPDPYALVDTLHDKDILASGSLTNLRVAYRVESEIHSAHTTRKLVPQVVTGSDVLKEFSCGSTVMGSGKGLRGSLPWIFQAKDEAYFIAKRQDNGDYDIEIAIRGKRDSKRQTEIITGWLAAAEECEGMREFIDSL